jgi:diguanylate cyclase (GGDEF)-like protein/PAS domain S-box-containing protein
MPSAKRLWSIPVLVACGILLTAIIAIGVVIMVLHFRDLTLANSQREIMNNSYLISRNIDQEFEKISAVQTSITEQILSLGIATDHNLEPVLSSHDLHLALKDKIAGLPQVAAIGLVNADGVLVNSSRPQPAPSLTLSDRNYYRAFKSDPALTSFVSEPILSRVDGARVIVIAKKITSPTGDFAGLVLATVTLDYFEKYFSSIKLREHGSIALFRNDGTLLVRYPRIEGTIGGAYSAGVNALRGRDSAHFRIVGRMDNKDRIIAAHRLRTVPLFASVGLDTETALTEWREQLRVVIGAAIAFVAITAFLLVLIARRLFRERYWSEQALMLKKTQLNTAINNMTQGLVMFGPDEKLILCNERYLDMYRLSRDVVKPDCSFQDLLDHRENGYSFAGDTREYAQNLRKEIAKGAITSHVFETGDGRLVQVVNRPMIDGGWVSTHEDITESKQREESFRLLFESNPVPMWVFDTSSLRFLAVNDATIAHYGYSRENFMTMRVTDIRPAEDREIFLRHFSETGGINVGETVWRHQKSDGSVIEVEVYSKLLTYGERAAALVAIIDVTKRRNVERERDCDREFLRQIIENVPVMIAVKDAVSRKFILANRDAEAIWGMSRSEVLGKTTKELFPPEYADLIDRNDDLALQCDGPLTIDAHPNMAKANDGRIVRSRRIAIRGDDGSPKYLVSVVEDLTESKEAEKRIARLAHYDSLTELPNRVLFRMRFEEALKGIRDGGRIAILCLDLDNFKGINDALGHPVGDDLLKAVAARLQQCVRSTDLIARLGGDEFAIVQTEVGEPRDVLDLVTRIQETIKQSYEAGGHQLISDTSIGIALAPDDGVDPDQLLRNADLALYEAKAAGRGTYHFFEPGMDARVKARQAMGARLASGHNGWRFRTALPTAGASLRGAGDHRA